MITYEYAKNDPQKHPVVVRLDGKVVGKIQPVQGGWQYRVKNGGVGGEVFSTLKACQRSLEIEG